MVVVATNLAPFTAVGDFGDVSGYGFMAIYAVLSVAALVYLRREGKLRALDVVASVVATAVMLYVYFENAFLPQPDGWIFYAVLASFGAMVVAYVLIAHVAPSVLARVGTSVDDDTALGV